MRTSTPPTDDSTLKIIGVSLAISFLYLIRVYRQLLYPAYNWYFEYEVPQTEILSSLFVSLLILCSSMIILLLARRERPGRRKNLFHFIFVVIAVLAFGPLSAELLVWCFGNTAAWFKYALPLVVLTACLLLSVRREGRLSRATLNLETAVLLILPVAILSFGQALLLGTGLLTKDLEPNSIESPIEKPAAKERPQRVVWVVFDELDFTAISERPSDIRLPAFEELESSSFVAENAFPPHYWTSVSLPALLVGRKVQWVDPHGPNNITLHFVEDEAAVELTKTETIFDDVLALNGKAAVAGWYHPYPRLFREKLAAGYWAPGSEYTCRRFSECVSFALAKSFENIPVFVDLEVVNPFVDAEQIPYIRNIGLMSFHEHSEHNRRLLEKGTRLVADERLDFVFLHFPIPHAPYLDRTNGSADSYFNALEAFDEALSALRRSMSGAGLLDRTTLIISSDHWMRSHLDSSDGQSPKKSFAIANTRIPFLVKLPGQSKPFRYPTPFNTAITRKLIGSVLTGEFKTTMDIAEWLDRAATHLPYFTNFHPCGFEKLDFQDVASSSEVLNCP
jgi:hypothetical protein